MQITHIDGTHTVTLDGQQLLTFDQPLCGTQKPTVEIKNLDHGWQHVRLNWHLPQQIQLDELSVTFQLAYAPDTCWAPHLTPHTGDCIAQHVFRSPALIATHGRTIVAIVPELELCGTGGNAPWFMDLDAPARTLQLGLTRTEVAGHVWYRKAPGLTLGPGLVQLGFFVIASIDDATPRNPWSHVSHFLWERYARPRLAQGEPGTTPLDRYVEHTYRWAFETWCDPVWQEFDLNGRRVGAPAFIVNVTQSPNHPGPWQQRESLSIWNQAWFSSLRSASGLMRYALRTGNEDLKSKAQLTKEFALAAPMNDGFFPSVYRTETTHIDIDGTRYARPLGWETASWTNSDRCPSDRGITAAWYHLLDATWTCLLMLRWHTELESDDRLLEYATRYANKLLSLQDADGFFPAWVHPKTHEAAAILRDSPECSLHVTFLLELASATGNATYRNAALKTMDAVLRAIVPDGRWEDFETYWSCSHFGADDLVGTRVARNQLYKQNTLSIFWTTEALLATYRATGDDQCLAWGVRTLDELSMAQQVWQPPFIHIPALGGFGVMNLDGEWNDARQSLFAELFLDFYRATGNPHYFERGIAALKASFAMMYCPENPQTKSLYEQAHPFFGVGDYGFMMENYAHGGKTDFVSDEIGDFTIYDWGNGAAAEACLRIRDHYGDVYIDRSRGHAFGIDSIAVHPTPDGWELHDRAQTQRDVTVLFEDGTTRLVHLDGCFLL